MDKVIGHCSETARRYYLLNDREQDARNALEVASILSPTASLTSTVMPQRLRDILDADHTRVPLPIQAVPRLSNLSWKTLPWGSGRPSDENRTRGIWTDEEIQHVAKELQTIKSRYPGNLLCLLIQHSND